MTTSQPHVVDRVLHIKIEEYLPHITVDDLAAVADLFAEQGWTSEVIPQRDIRKGPVELSCHLLNFIFDEHLVEHVKYVMRHAVTVVAVRQRRRDVDARRWARGTRCLGEDGELLWPPDLDGIDRSK